MYHTPQNCIWVLYFESKEMALQMCIHSVQSRLSLKLACVVKVFGKVIGMREILVFIKCKAFWSCFESISCLSGQTFGPEGSTEMVS